MNKCCSINKNFKDLLAEKFIQATQSKIDTLELFYASNIPLGSKEIISGLPIYNESTIFRNLTRLKEANILEEVDLGEGYKRFAIKHNDHHHHYAKCTSCKKILKINKCSIRPIKNELKTKGFIMSSHRIEVYGLCDSCV